MMITVNDVFFPNGYTPADHLLPCASEVFCGLIGKEFQSTKQIKDAARSAANAYDENVGYHKLVGATSTKTTRAKIVMANGEARTIDV